MSVYLNAYTDGFGYTGTLPSGTYWAGCVWFFCTTTATSRGGVLTLGNTSGSDWCCLAVYSDGTPALYVEYEGGSTSLLEHSANTWYYGYIRNDGSTLKSGWATRTGTFSTNSQTNRNVTTPGTLGIGCYDPRGEGSSSYTKDHSVANCLIWSGSAAADLPTEEQLQLQRAQMRPIKRDNLWVWQPCWSASITRDLSGNGRTVTTAGSLGSTDHPPVGWGAAAPLVIRPSSGPPSRNPVPMGFVVG